jgi:C4-dicarboxylate-specific signal transduction histidine kinase
VTTDVKAKLRLLLIEDSDNDAEVVRRVLRRSGFDLQITRADDEAGVVQALAREELDLVISDYQLPSFDGLAALALVRAARPDLPFIVVSGRVGEDVAVDAVRRGANDYLLKQSLARLPLAVERELREADLRRERGRYREQLVVTERLATIGTLASGLVHEINNPLASMTANLFCVAESLARAEAGGADQASACLRELRDPIAELQAACAMVGTISADVKIFARSVNAQDGDANLADVIASAERVARFAFRQRARFVRDFEPVPTVKGDSARLAQVFLNLILNAAQAIPEGNPEGHEIRAVLRAEDGGRVRAEISDTGVGMAPDVLAQVFENFFSTKNGKGMGLGTTISRWIVEACGGEMQAESTPGRGTTFRMHFLAAPTRKSREPQADEAVVSKAS